MVGVPRALAKYMPDQLGMTVFTEFTTPGMKNNPDVKSIGPF